MAESSECPQHPEISGWLFKWTNYLRGYQKRWFVLSNGYLCYYRNREEMAHTCRGTLSLRGATILSEESNNLIVSNGETFHIKAPNDIEKRKWVDALVSAKDLASTRDSPSRTVDSPVTTLATHLKDKLEEVKTWNELINNHGEALELSLSEVERISTKDETARKMKDVNEKAEIFRASTSTMIKACSDYLDLAESHYDKWVTLVQKESPRKIQIEKVLESVTSPNRVENSIGKEHPSDEENSEFFDCEDALQDRPQGKVDKTAIKMYSAVVGGSKGSSSDGKGKDSSSTTVSHSLSSACGRARRTRVADRPKVSANLWNIIKNAVGKDLTKIPVPVNFAEPLSLLQRLTEDFEYAHSLLDVASSNDDPGEQMAYVASFAVSSYSTTINRVGKPFNPLLGETYECDRSEDLGWKSVAEQVSHHPPVAALYCESKNWECWQEQSMSTKFRGHYLQIIPQGEVHLKFKKCNLHYAWKKATTNVHNIIIGKLWIDQEGDLDIKCYTNGYSCKLTFLSPGYFSGDPYQLKGVVTNNQGKSLFSIIGGYDSKLELCAFRDVHKTSKASNISNVETKVLWNRVMPPEDSEKYYNFTVFACQLNEIEPGVAPTDTRNRPDQRLMEEGKFDQANSKKQELEETQRASRRKRQDKMSTHSDDSQQDVWRPTWFSRDKDPDTQTEMFVYRGEYWPCKSKKDWSRCPQIYSSDK